MKKPINLFIWLSILVISKSTYSQNNLNNTSAQFLLSTIKQLDSCLINSDVESLRILMHPKITFGHSNGLIEDYTGVQMDLLSKKIVYTTIQNQELPTIYFTDSSTIIYRRLTKVTGLFQGDSFSVMLNILEIWKLESNQWRLIARQSVKKND